MILTCPKCATRLKLEAAALPDSTFNVLCPKCQTVISVVPSMVTQRTGSAVHNQPMPFNEPLAGFSAGAATAPQPEAVFQPPAEAPAAQSPAVGSAPAAAPTEQTQDQMSVLASLLASVLNKSAAISGAYRPSINPEEFLRRRNVLVCLRGSEDLTQVRGLLKNHEYELLPAESAEQALELLQLSNKVDIVLLSPDFQPDNQGSTAILRFISALSPERRRRLFLVLFSSSSRTADVRVAFNQGANLVINAGEIHLLPLALTKSIRDFNYLYRAFNEASGSAPF
ncbi:MAG TPA: zinc-ribbon domain-containing protein [Blastocatellia bacterium]|nr:zinc-ribbon domain-containing protein [Blastocatellia bacterium]